MQRLGLDKKIILGLVFPILVISCVSRQSSLPLPATVQPIAQVQSREPNSVETEITHQLESSNQFDWPVDQARLTRGFKPKKKRSRGHYGLDLASNKGTPILASTRGTVLYVGKDFRGYGKMILVEGANGWATIYAHLDKILVSEGQTLRRGQVIATMGRTGRATGVHLHFEIRHNKVAVDPLPILPAAQRIAVARK